MIRLLGSCKAALVDCIGIRLTFTVKNVSAFSILETDTMTLNFVQYLYVFYFFCRLPKNIDRIFNSGMCAGFYIC